MCGADRDFSLCYSEGRCRIISLESVTEKNPFPLNKYVTVCIYSEVS